MRAAGKSFDVVGVGYCCEDTLLVVDRYPERNTKAEIRERRRSGGGQVATALVALARLGMRVAFHGRVGDDDAGRRALDALAAEGVDVDGAIVTPGVETQMAVIVVDRATGERTIFWRRAAELELTRDDVDADLVRRGQLLHVDGHERGALRALGIARSSGITTSMDAERAGDLQKAMLPLVDLLVAAETFPANLLGAGADPVAALPAIRALGPREVVVTLGERGAVGFDGIVIERAAAAIPPALVDSTGAGDAFHGAYLHAHLQGLELRHKLSFANAGAALSLRELGGRAGLPSLPELLALLPPDHPARTERP